MAGFSSFFSTMTASVVSKQRGNGRRVLERRARHLVGSMTPATTRSSYVSVSRVVAEVLVLRRAHLLHDDGAFTARIVHDHADGFLDGAAHDVDADLLVRVGLMDLRAACAR